MNDNSAANRDEKRNTIGNAAPLPPSPFVDDRLLLSSEIELALGVTVRKALNIDVWEENGGLESLLDTVDKYVTGSTIKRERLRVAIRRHVLSRLHELPDAAEHAGVYPIAKHRLRDATRNLLLRGQVTAVNGACTGHDSLAATLVSIGVGLVCYDGRLNSWKTTFLRHDYDLQSDDSFEETRRVLDRQGQRSSMGTGIGFRRDHLSDLLRRGFMAAAERKTLLERTNSRWRLGHGTPAPLELLTGSGSMELIDEMLPVLEQLLLKATRWVFVPSTLSNRALATLADALEERQLAIFQKGKVILEDMVERGTYAPKYKERVRDFAARTGESIVVGGFRATRHGPAQLFVAHAEHALIAGIIAMADAALQPHKGFPLLLDLAGLSAKVGLGMDAFQQVIESAYAKAGADDLYAGARFREMSETS